MVIVHLLDSFIKITKSYFLVVHETGLSLGSRISDGFLKLHLYILVEVLALGLGVHLPKAPDMNNTSLFIHCKLEPYFENLSCSITSEEGATVAQWSHTCLPPLRLAVQTQTLCGKIGSCLPMVGSLQCRTLINCLYWFPLPTKLHVVI